MTDADSKMALRAGLAFPMWVVPLKTMVEVAKAASAGGDVKLDAGAGGSGPALSLHVALRLSDGSRICRLRALLETTSSIAPPAAGIVSGSPPAWTATGGLYPVWLGGTE